MSDTRHEDTTLLAKSGIAYSRASAEATRVHYLVLVEGEGKGLRIALGKDPLVIGRNDPADIVLADPRVSRSHCRVCVAMNEVIVIDLQSSNGTYIDGERLTGGAALPVGSRLQLGSHVFEHEWRIRKEVEESQNLDRDLEQAWNYIRSLLPEPLTEGPVRSDWVLVPCARLGGDAFGYRFLDASHFAMYLIDVSGHGAGAAMHAVSVINVLRQAVLPEADYRNPAKVLESLDAMFRMETHNNLYLTVWYGVYDLDTRTLEFASAGHPPAFIVGPARDEATPLKTKNRAIGVAQGTAFTAQSAEVAPGSMLYVFSDGVYEVTSKDETDWELENFVALMIAPPAEGIDESRRLLEAVRSAAKTPELDDDFTLIAFAFPGRRSERTPDSTWPDRG